MQRKSRLTPFARCSAALFLFIALLAPLLAAAADRAHPGYIDLDRFAAFDDADAIVDVRLDGWLLGLARKAALESGDDDARILTGIDSIRVRVFEADLDFDRFRRTADRFVDDLRRDGWEDFTTVRGRDGYVYVMVLGDRDRLDGLTVIAMDDENEAVFVNIAGSIRAEDIGRLLADSDLMHLDMDLEW